MLAGHDPSAIEFRRVLDVTWALVIEVYKEYGMKFQEASEEMSKRIFGADTPEGKKARAPKAPDDAASMAMLQAMMKSTSFGGPKG